MSLLSVIYSAASDGVGHKSHRVYRLHHITYYWNIAIGPTTCKSNRKPLNPDMLLKAQIWENEKDDA